jgi:hypothetical protein
MKNPVQIKPRLIGFCRRQYFKQEQQITAIYLDPSDLGVELECCRYVERSEANGRWFESSPGSQDFPHAAGLTRRFMQAALGIRARSNGPVTIRRGAPQIPKGRVLYSIMCLNGDCKDVVDVAFDKAPKIRDRGSDSACPSVAQRFGAFSRSLNAE